MTDRMRGDLAVALALVCAVVAVACVPGIADAWISRLPTSLLPGWWVWGLSDAVVLPKRIVTWVLCPPLIAAGLALSPRGRGGSAWAYALLGVLLVAWLALATHLGLWPAAGWEPVWALGCVVITGGTAALALDGPSATRLLRLLALPALPVALYSLAQHLGFEFLAWDPRHAEAERSISTFGNPDFLATWLALGVPISVWRASEAPSPRGRLGWGAASALVVVTVVFSYTRAAWLALTLAVPVLAILRVSRWRSEAWAGFLVTGAVLAVLLAARPAGLFTVAGRIGQTFGGDQSVSVRLCLWHEAWRVALAHPLLGTGPDTFSYAAMPFRADEPAWLLARVGLPGDPHNAFLEMAVNGGFVALALLLAQMGVAGYAALRARRGDPETTAAAGVVLVCGLILCVEHLLVQATLPTLWMGALLGAVAVSLSTSKTELSRPRLAVVVLLTGGLAVALWSAWVGVRIARADFQAAVAEGRGQVGLRRGGEQGIVDLRGAVAGFDAALASCGEGVRAARIAGREARLLEQVLLRLDPSGADAEGTHALAQHAAECAYFAAHSSRLDPYAWHDFARIALLAADAAPDPSAAGGLRQQAITAARLGCELDPFNAALLADLARQLARIGEYAHADEVFRRSLALAPARSAVELDHADLLARWGRREECEGVLREVVRREPGNAEAADRLLRLDQGPSRAR